MALFIGGSLGFAAPVIKDFTMARDAELAEIRGDIDVGMLTEMTRAMMAGDREEFISWGEGRGREQLAHLWDETKKIGWSVGVVGPGASEKGLDELTTDELTLDIHVDLGFTHERERFASAAREELYPEGTEEYNYGQGILVSGFTYDAQVEGINSTQRIVSMTPRAPMPWDDPVGVGVARSENAVLFGYADEQAQLDERLDDAQVAAAGVLGTDLATHGFVTTPGFTGFYTEDEQRYLDAVHSGEIPDRQWHESGVAVPSLTPMYDYKVPEAEREEWGIFTGLDSSAVLAYLPGHRMNSPLRTFTHEFAHINHLENISTPFLEDDGDGAYRPAVEGYATYVEDTVASQHDGEVSMLATQVREAIATAQDVNALVSGDAFESDETVNLAYNVSANIYAYIEDQGGSVVDEVMRAEYVDLGFGSWLSGVLKRNGGANYLDGPDLWQEWNAQ